MIGCVIKIGCMIRIVGGTEPMLLLQKRKERCLGSEIFKVTVHLRSCDHVRMLPYKLAKNKIYAMLPR